MAEFYLNQNLGDIKVYALCCYAVVLWMAEESVLCGDAQGLMDVCGQKVENYS